MRLSIIAILLSFSTILQAQTDTIPDTITLSAQHQRILPELIRQQNELQKAINDVNEKLMILLTAYIDDPRKLQNGAVQFSQDMKKIIVK